MPIAALGLSLRLRRHRGRRRRRRRARLRRRSADRRRRQGRASAWAARGAFRIGDRDGTNLALIGAHDLAGRLSLRHPVRRAAGSSGCCSASRSARPTSRTTATSASSSAPSSRSSRSSNVSLHPARLVAGPLDRCTAASAAAAAWGSTGEDDHESTHHHHDRRAAAATAHAQRVRHVPPARRRGRQAARARRRRAGRRRRRSSRTSARTGTHAVRRRSSSCARTTRAGSRSCRPTTVVAPGVDYYIAAGDQPVFATPEWPHTIAVTRTAPTTSAARATMIRARRPPLADARDGRVGRVRHAHGRRRSSSSISYYRFDADFSYRLWTYPLEEIRVGYTRLLGDTHATDGATTTACTTEAGFKVGGWFELGLAAVEGVRFDGRMIVMATAGRLRGRWPRRGAPR